MLFRGISLVSLEVVKWKVNLVYTPEPFQMHLYNGFFLGYTTTAIKILIQIRENVNNALKTGHSLTLS